MNTENDYENFKSELKSLYEKYNAKIISHDAFFEDFNDSYYYQLNGVIYNDETVEEVIFENIQIIQQQ